MVLQHVEDERAADALTVKVAAVDPQMVEHRDVVGGVAIPAVLCGDRGARLAAGIALIHRDDAVFVGELGGGVDRRRRLAPDIDHRGEPGRREGQDRKALAELLVVNMGAMVVDARHVVLLPGADRQAGMLIDLGRETKGPAPKAGPIGANGKLRLRRGGS